jgi:hypothetical protein
MDEARARELQAIWNGYLDELKKAGEQLFRPSTPDDPQTLAEGLRHLTRMTRLGLETNVEFCDPDFPVLSRLIDETKKFGCDNPDTIYMRGLINGAHAYRIVGRRGTVDYLSFLSLKPGADGRLGQVGFIDSKSLHTDADGAFELSVSSEAPPSGNWLRIDSETTTLSVRQTFLDRRRETPAELRIERVGQGAVPAPITIAQISDRLAAASRWAVYSTQTFTDWTESYLAHPNALPPADQEKCLKAGGDPNIYFYRSFWMLGPDEALVVRIPRIPACDTWNLQVDNYWQESMDYRYVRSHVNKHTAAVGADGSVTVVIAHQDPAHLNWLSTSGHRLGHFAMRWVRAAEHVDPATKLCKFNEIGAAIAALGGGR